MKLAVIVLSCNQLHLTNDLMSDIKQQDEDLDIYVVDNGGNYERQHTELIIKPKENLRWVKGNNLGLKIANGINDRYEGFVLLNDDIRLSPQFFDGLREAYSACGSTWAGLIAPLYDDVFDHQKRDYSGIAEKYQGVDDDHRVPFVDGTAFFLSNMLFRAIGYLDEKHFGNYGWGADVDYNIRARQEGFTNIVTERAYINHFHQGSAKYVETDWSGKAGLEMGAGMEAKYGAGWSDVMWDKA